MDAYPIILGGVKKHTDEIVNVRFPYTGEIYARVCQAGQSDLEEAVASAVRGFEKTRTLSSGSRSNILIRLADEIHRRSDELVDVMVMEGGKTKKFAINEVSRAEITVRTSAEEAKRIYGEILPLDWTGESEGRIGFLQRFPLGPVVGIVPFNFPLNLACHKLAPAIAAGNPVILNPHLRRPCAVSSLVKWHLMPAFLRKR